ncbi:MAG: hypothetical protein DHS20C21_10960 [Gemmatimonadota bacterium]|nr:MAG: hypothetical protein DHS20C21_10960 [Gemmatimonadota bacterium]
MAGRLAAEWIGLGETPEPLPFRFVLAAALHDLAWADADREARWDESASGPFAFGTVNDDYREPLYRAGIDTLESIDDYAALLKSLHYARFLPDRPAFVSFEEARRARILDRLPAAHADPATIERHRSLLIFFDFLSLFCLLTGPGAVEPAEWLTADRVGRTPSGESFSLRWQGPAELRLAPFPFARSFRLAVPARHLPLTFGTEADLAAAWASAPAATVEVRLGP